MNLKRCKYIGIQSADVDKNMVGIGFEEKLIALNLRSKY